MTFDPSTTAIGGLLAGIGGNGEIILPQLADEQAAYGSFYESTNSGKASYRDSSGVANALY